MLNVNVFLHVYLYTNKQTHTSHKPKETTVEPFMLIRAQFFSDMAGYLTSE